MIHSGFINQCEIQISQAVLKFSFCVKKAPLVQRDVYVCLEGQCLIFSLCIN